MINILKTSDLIVRIYVQIFLLLIMIIGMSTNFFAADREFTHRYLEKKTSLRLSHPLKDYLSQIQKKQIEGEYTKMIASGTIIIGGLKMGSPIKVGYENGLISFNSFFEKAKYPFADWRRYAKKKTKWSQIRKEVSQDIREMFYKDISIDKCVSEIKRKYAENEEVEDISFSGDHVLIKYKGIKDCHSFLYAEFTKTSSWYDPNDGTNGSKNPDPLKDQQFLKITEALESGKVLYFTSSVDGMQILDEKFIADLDAVLSKYPTIDYDKTAGHYSNELNEIIQVIEQYIPRMIKPNKVENAAILLANWHRKWEDLVGAGEDEEFELGLQGIQ